MTMTVRTLPGETGLGMRATATAAVAAPPTEALVAAARIEEGVRVYGRPPVAVRALDGVTVSFERGHYTAIMGPSGSGKSTLLHCLAGLDRLTYGRTFVAGTDLGRLDDRRLTRLRRERIGFVFQAFNLLPTLTAAENLVLPLAMAGRRPDPEWVDTVVDVIGLRDRLHHRPAQLSGGEQQRVAVGRTLVSRPEVIFADEPTGNLDSRTGSELLAFLRRAVDEFGQTIVMVTHDPRAAAVADRIVFLADGRVVDEITDPTPRRAIDHLERLGR